MGNTIISDAVNIPENSLLKSKLEKNDELKIMFLGGSITAGFDGKQTLSKSYPNLLTQYLKKSCNRPVTAFNYSMSAYMSAMGLIEYAAHYRQTKPDIVILEFAVNDNFDRYNAQYYESLMRKILASDGSPAVICVNCCRNDLTGSEAYMNELAGYYGAPSASIAKILEKAGRNKYFSDSVHPSQAGHRIIFAALRYIFDNCADGNAYPMKKCLYGDIHQNVEFYDNSTLITDTLGSFIPCCINERYQNGFRHEKGSESLTFTIAADGHNGTLTVVHIINSTRNLYGSADVYVNGTAAATLDGYSIFGWDNPVCFGVALPVGQDCTVEIKMHSGSLEKRFDILGFGF